MGSVQSDSTASCHREVLHRKSSINRTRSNTASFDDIYQRYNETPCEDEGYGWYEDCDTMSATGETHGQHVLQALVLPAPVCEPPMYVLESSLEEQQLWYKTAGQRPPQPEDERTAMEKVWMENFALSQIRHSNVVPWSSGPVSSRSYDSGKSIIRRGESKLSNSVSMSFTNEAVSSMTIQMPSYRIVHDENQCMFAEYLIMTTFGGRGTVPFGVWRRHSDFEQLARNIQDIVERTQELHTFRHTRLSWECVRRHKKWFRSFDADYLELKCYLLERFMQDLLCETSSCRLICNFLGIQ